MAGEIQLNSTTMATESSGTITLSNVNSATNRTNLGLGSIATQAADSVSISGGNITGGTIGSSVVFPAGHIVQTVFSTDTAESIFSSDTPTSIANLTKAITLKTSNPYVLVILALNSVGKTTSDTALGTRLTADDSASLDIILSDLLGYSGNTGDNFASGYQAFLHDLTSDSAGTTITYTPKFYSANNTASVYINAKFVSGTRYSHIMLMEIQK